MNKKNEEVAQVNFRIYGDTNILKWKALKKKSKKYAKSKGINMNDVLSNAFLEFYEYYIGDTIEKKGEHNYTSRIVSDSILKVMDDNIIPRINGIVQESISRNNVYLKIINYKINYLTNKLYEKAIIKEQKYEENLSSLIQEWPWSVQLFVDVKENLYKKKNGYIDSDEELDKIGKFKRKKKKETF